jgi:inner membrane protein
MRYPLLGRFLVVAGVALALLVPLSLIRDKISERRDRADAVQKAFADQASGPQAVAGPFLVLTCEETDDKMQRACPMELLLPGELKAEAKAPVEQRYRGIYPIRFYRARLELSGAFQQPASAHPARKWKDAFLVLGIRDARGIKDAPGARIGTREYAFVPGTLDTGIPAGLHARLGRADELAKDFRFHIPLELTGTGRFDIAPVGSQNDIAMESGWPHPSFGGAYSPDRSRIGPTGFSAGWRVNHFATGGAAFWRDAMGDKLFGDRRLVGFALAEPVNPYSMSFRAMEYGFVFVLLTFAAFSLVELVWRVKLHPVQYALTGSALAVFFLLLISLSEHIRFSVAYLSAASACVALLAAYLRHPLGNAWRTALLGALFASLYAALYVLLKSEDHSLLLGSLLVFGVLAAVMLLTRRLDWAALSGRLRQPLADPS